MYILIIHKVTCLPTNSRKMITLKANTVNESQNTIQPAWDFWSMVLTKSVKQMSSNVAHVKINSFTVSTIFVNLVSYGDTF